MRVFQKTSKLVLLPHIPPNTKLNHEVKRVVVEAWDSPTTRMRTESFQKRLPDFNPPPTMPPHAHVGDGESGCAPLVGGHADDLRRVNVCDQLSSGGGLEEVSVGSLDGGLEAVRGTENEGETLQTLPHQHAMTSATS